MNKKNNYIYIILAGLGIYYLLNKRKSKGSIIVDTLQSLKPYAQAYSVLYDNDLNTPIYTFNVDTLIKILDQDTERGIYQIEFKSETFGTITGFISQYKIISK